MAEPPPPYRSAHGLLALYRRRPSDRSRNRRAPSAPTGRSPRPTTTPDDEDDARAPSDLTNGDLARIFHEIGDILEVQGEIAFKTIAYHRAADAIGRSPIDLVAAYRAGHAAEDPGVGKAISDKITELVTTGRMAYYERLRRDPAEPRRAARDPRSRPEDRPPAVYEELGVETIEDLRQAAEAGTLRSLKGLSERTEQQILAGIAALETPAPAPMLLHRGRGDHRRVIALSRTPGLRSIQPAGSFRRGARRSATSTSSPRPTTRGR